MSPKSTIICATDLSETAQPAMAVAAALTRSLHARLELFHVIHMPPGLPAEFLRDGAIINLRAAATAALEARAKELRKTGIDVSVHVGSGLVDDGIVLRAAELGAELLVVATHARAGAARFFVGSVAERTVRAASCPVVVVPPTAEGRLVGAEPPSGPLRVLAGIDLSTTSDAALRWLRKVNQQMRCDVRLVHRYWPPREHERLGLAPPDQFETDPEAVSVLTRDLQAHITEHLGRVDVPLSVRPMWGAAEGDRLVWEPEPDYADLLVVGTSQRRASTALAVVRSARVPVVCVPKPVFETVRDRLQPVRTVLVTTDLSPLGDAAVPEAYRLLLRGGGTVMLASVAESGPHGLETDRHDAIQSHLLGLVPTNAANHAIHTRTFVIADPSPGEAILKAIRRLGPDLVVMSSHGRTGFRRSIHGSVAEHVVRASPRPVLVVPAPEALGGFA